jgi:hypothetical protein
MLPQTTPGRPPMLVSTAASFRDWPRILPRFCASVGRKRVGQTRKMKGNQTKKTWKKTGRKAKCAPLFPLPRGIHLRNLCWSGADKTRSGTIFLRRIDFPLSPHGSVCAICVDQTQIKPAAAQFFPAHRFFPFAAASKKAAKRIIRRFAANGGRVIRAAARRWDSIWMP